MSYRYDSGSAVVNVHLGPPGTFNVREFDTYSPFVSIEVIPDVALLCYDPEALASLGRAVRRAQQRLSALQQGDQRAESAAYFPDVDGEAETAVRIAG